MRYGRPSEAKREGEGDYYLKATSASEDVARAAIGYPSGYPEPQNGSQSSSSFRAKCLILLAITAGFEPATHGVEIRYWNLADPSLGAAAAQRMLIRTASFSAAATAWF